MKTAVVMGLGASGRAALKLLMAQGYRCVGVDLRTDLQPIEGVELQLGPHRRQTFVAADLIVVSPGIPLSVPDLVAARQAGVEVIGEIALAVRYALLDQPCVGITGTNGKSTVTHFTGQLLRPMNPFVGGNLGRPLSTVTEEHGAVVVELSSYQLESAGAFRADVGVILNLTPDHLARHKTMASYAAAKCRLFENARPTDVALIPAGDAWITAATAGERGERAWIGALPGVVRRGREVEVQRAERRAVFDLTPFCVPGEHNLDNVATALFLAWCLGGDAPGLQQRIAGLTALEHRMSIVHRGRFTWIDDSKSTNIDSTLAALRGRTRSTVLLLGGRWKGPGFERLLSSMGAVHLTICFGEHGREIAAELPEAVVVETLVDALSLARKGAREGDDILLSPGCASFDEFTDFAQRGRVFARWAQEHGDA